jgi:hypothetical protein
MHILSDIVFENYDYQNSNYYDNDLVKIRYLYSIKS